MKKADWYELLGSDDYPHLVAANHLCGELADALIAIVAQPWLPGKYGPMCPYCLIHHSDAHTAWCPFPRTARALGIAD